MRILFRSLSGYGHLYPLMPLAEAAREAGHDVVISTAGDLVEDVRSAGFTAIAAGVTLAEAIVEAYGPNAPPTTVDGQTDWDVVGAFFARAAARAADDLVTLLPEVKPDVVVYENTDAGAAIAAAAAGIPSVRLAIVRGLPKDIESRFAELPFAELRRRYGVADGVGQLPELVLDTYPPSVQLPEALADPRRVPMQPLPWSDPSATVPAWVGRHDGPLVYLTVGTVPGYFGTLETAIEGLAALDVDVLVATGARDPDELGPLPRRVHVTPFVHFADLLPSVDLMVHHGGCGTTTGAWVHGIPQLVWPHGADHHANAHAVVASGSGLALERWPSPDEVAKAAQMLLDAPRFAYGAELVRSEIATLPAPAEVVELLHQFLHHRQPNSGMAPINTVRH